MKTITFLLMLFYCSMTFGQKSNYEQLMGARSDSSIIADSLLCAERGHISSGCYSETLMYCPPYIIDTDSTTILVYPSCNWRSYNCARCKKQVSEKEPERRVILWRKE